MPKFFSMLTSLVGKLKRKRRITSDMHPRWGDASITYPIDGSWSQPDPSVEIAGNARLAQLSVRPLPVMDQEVESSEDRRKVSQICPSDGDNQTLQVDSDTAGTTSAPHRRQSLNSQISAGDEPASPIHPAHYDPQLGLQATRRRSDREHGKAASWREAHGSENAPEQDQLVDVKPKISPTSIPLEEQQSATASDWRRVSPAGVKLCRDGDEDEVEEERDSEDEKQDEDEDEMEGVDTKSDVVGSYQLHFCKESTASRSPPLLSTTSRMRRDSHQSATTDQTDTTTSIVSPGATVSSRHTSFTASSVSAPSVAAPDNPLGLVLPPGDTRRHYRHHPFHQPPDKRVARGARRRDKERTLTQELVPSYEDLYG